MFQISEDKNLSTKKIMENTYSTLIDSTYTNLLYGYTVKKDGAIAKRLHNYIIGYQEDGTFVFIPINIHGNLEGEILKVNRQDIKRIKVSKQWNCGFYTQSFYLEIIIPPYSPDVNATIGLMIINQKSNVEQFYQFIKSFQ